MSKEFTIKSDGSADDLRYSDGNPASDAELGDSESLKDLQRNPFLDPKVEAYWRQIYEQAQYECRHEFDPHAQWTPKEEKKLVRKLDLRITTWACIMFFALNMDRKNLPSALAGNLLPQLGLTTNDYNYGQTIFLVSFLLAEVPSQLISKRIGPDRWIPIQMVLWSIVAMAQAGLNGRGTFYACRALLGVLEGGFIPDLVLWLSYFYTSSELPVRLSYFWVSLNLTGVVIGLLGFALLRLDGVSGLAGWRWLFLVEGLITLVIVVNRVLRDDPGKGDMHNRQGIGLRGLWRAAKDYHLWPLYAIGVVVYIPQAPPSNYLTLSLRALGFDPLTTNLLTIPPVVVGCFTLVGLSILSEKVNQRALVSMIQNVWILPCIIALRFWPGTMENAWGTYALIVVLLSYPYCHAIVVAWTSRNSGSVRNRSISAAFYNMCVQIGNVISANIYVASDSPKYHNGNAVLLALSLLSILLFLATKVYYVRINNKREKIWSQMSVQEREHYVENTTDEANRRLDFRFAH
ncbi:MAG: hypothetical protein GOMPHAMPRED_007247 [Gomphillus americanus]|uniref:Allantoate permease n=1 Tax=Gomphillus americanus TaxID=1940652 RepID=A0A8H3I852_9LECA|nr:MAG: hypothetical protein GOMPHAMPRED_007247 [Gomphillus americanus]